VDCALSEIGLVAAFVAFTGALATPTVASGGAAAAFGLGGVGGGIFYPRSEYLRTRTEQLLPSEFLFILSRAVQGVIALMSHERKRRFSV
jgi:hypothetical protein